ncbi:hypothetical protein D187_008580 [Cystobacter fuscus DSM 2262]|uniref:Uncharacterized protein n=1 Tax=Cystobacter fuscus (strain ATCC 25194 / DSM 2262 / NBRC 100088 / M29) TaxID=1242864 RepID=S9PIZ9_CYSF2|nr:hypothetical protein D187_008580 [Cystobacter fuscus DSM 2262]
MDFARTNFEVHARQRVDPGKTFLDSASDEDGLSTHASR